MSLLLLPPEIRGKIYYHIITSEQDKYLEYVGNGGKRVQYDFCLPLRKVRPPVLIRVCKTLRYEYLPHFFRSMCFRMYVDIQTTKIFEGQSAAASTTGPQLGVPYQFATFPSLSRSVTASQQRTPPPAECTILETPAKNWLDSLRSRDGVRFRQLQIRFVTREGRPIGASFSITYNSRERKYELDFKLDEGWNMGGRIVAMGLHFNVVVGASQVLQKLQDICGSANDEGLDWKMLEYLIDGFRIQSHVHPRAVQLPRPVEDWSQDVKLLAAV